MRILKLKLSVKILFTLWNYNCNCHRKFSDPDARPGWDSYHEVLYYGHCGYFLVVYNPELKKDLPIYLRLVQAQRYDGAHDNNSTYDLLNAWNMKAIIPMIYDYYDKVHHRIKWRYPYAKGKIKSCSCKNQCSPSTYGRTIYTKPKWDPCIFTTIPRGSKKWKLHFAKIVLQLFTLEISFRIHSINQ